MVRRWRYLLVCALVACAGFYSLTFEAISVPTARPFDEFPTLVGDWRQVGESRFSANVEAVLKATDYIFSIYANEEDEKVGLYVGYHSGGKESGAIHSPKHCLPGAGWNVLSQEVFSIPAGDDERAQVVKAIYQKDDEFNMFIYWFQMRGDHITDEYVLKFSELAGAMVHRRKDAAFVRISTVYRDDADSAEELVRGFATKFKPVIDEFLPE